MFISFAFLVLVFKFVYGLNARYIDNVTITITVNFRLFLFENKSLQKR